MKQKYQSKIMEAIHEEAHALYAADAINKERMAEYDRACLVSEPHKSSTTANPAPARGIRPVTPAYAHH